MVFKVEPQEIRLDDHPFTDNDCRDFLYGSFETILAVTVIVMAVRYWVKKETLIRKVIQQKIYDGYSGSEGAIKLAKEGYKEMAAHLLYVTSETKIPYFEKHQHLENILFMDAIVSRVEAAAKEHADTLVRKSKQLVAHDDYGIIDASLWKNELKYFMKNVVKVDFDNDPGMDFLSDSDKACLELNIEQKILEVISNSHDSQSHEARFKGGSGLDYERWCSEVLSRHGWNSRTTPATGDQGADIIAEKNGIRIVIQCKYHSSPVSNKAVQEVASSRDFYGANYAVVVTNSSYTRSAKALSASTGVALIHDSDLKNLDNYFAVTAEAASP